MKDQRAYAQKPTEFQEKCEHEWVWKNTRYGVMKLCRHCNLVPAEVEDFDEIITL